MLMHIFCSNIRVKFRSMIYFIDFIGYNCDPTVILILNKIVFFFKHIFLFKLTLTRVEQYSLFIVNIRYTTSNNYKKFSLGVL